MRDNFYMTVILICAGLMLLAGLAFTGLEILHYTQEPELPGGAPQQQRSSAARGAPESSPAPNTEEETGEPSETQAQ
mgnify:CR=1 FL=1